MDRRIPLLAAILAAQLVLIAGLMAWSGAANDPGSGLQFDFEPGSVDALRIDDGDVSVELTRGDGGWELAGETPLPADSAKVAEVLGKLGEAGAAWPVATSSASARRFEVSADDYQRHVQVAAADSNVVDLYTGTSPGFRKVHARQADDQAVYAITLSNFEVPTGADDWLDKALLQPSGELQRLTSPDWSLSRVDGAWLLAGLGDDRITSQEPVQEVIEKLRNVRVLGVSDGAVAADLEAAYTLSIADDAGEAEFVFYQPDEDGEYLVTSSRRNETFRMALYMVEQLRVERAELIALAPVESLDAKPPGP